ncbi:hypothetical protein N0V90_007375 [Kalmusia sp. IMI 367209]|nr:hypothetical protein N0V90_007375 [Kalmusia sp. IMI 367209]
MFHQLWDSTDRTLFHSDVTPNETYIPSEQFGKEYPHYGAQLDSTNFTCGRDAIKSAGATETAALIAGSQIGFRVIPQIDVGNPYNNTIFHEGPGYIYMAKAPESGLGTWVGDEGDWFKIKEWLAVDATHWSINKTWSDLNFTIPESTPPGRYLLRVEQFTFSPYVQFYVNCAQVDILGVGGGTPGPFAKFPGSYNYTDINYSKSKERNREVY